MAARARSTRSGGTSHYPRDAPPEKGKHRRSPARVNLFGQLLSDLLSWTKGETQEDFTMANDNGGPDVVVIGGGPAGSTVSTLLAQRGCQVRLFEREHFPRFHIGESLIPETYWVLRRLNVLDKLRGSHFVKKYSVQFVSQKGRLSEPFFFVEHKPHEASQTWQLRRSEFVQMMLNNAREH